MGHNAPDILLRSHVFSLGRQGASIFSNCSIDDGEVPYLFGGINGGASVYGLNLSRYDADPSLLFGDVRELINGPYLSSDSCSVPHLQSCDTRICII